MKNQNIFGYLTGIYLNMNVRISIVSYGVSQSFIVYV